MPLVNREMTKKLRDIFYRTDPPYTVIPGGILPIHAIMAEKAGYEAFYISGGMSHRQLLGVVDFGLRTTTEFADWARRITTLINIPVISDGDVAGGNPLNVYRTVKEYIWAGCAGIHIEDVVYPKGVSTQGQGYGLKAGTISTHMNARIVSIEEMKGRLGAAVAAKNELDPNFVIIGRTDAREAIGGGLEEAIRRGQEYEKIPGVDVIMFDGMRTREEAEKAVKSVKLPAFNTGANQSRWKPRHVDGEKVLFEVGLGWNQAAQTAWEIYVGYRKRGVEAVDEWQGAQEKKSAELRWTEDKTHLDRFKMYELQEKFLPKRTD